MRSRKVGKFSSFCSAVMISVLLLAALLPSSQVVSGSTEQLPGSTIRAIQQPRASAVLAPTEVTVAQEYDATVVLSWDRVTGASAFKIYRTTTQGINYTLVDTVPANSFQLKYNYKDEGLTNQETYFYVVTTIDRNNAESSPSNEIAAMPHLVITWAGNMLPKLLENYQIGAPDPVTITGRLNIKGYTGEPGPAPGIIGYLGYGQEGTAPSTWVNWVPATYIGKPVDEGPVANDLYQASFRPQTAGDYNFVYRFSSTLGRDWIYGGRDKPVDPNLPAGENNEMIRMTILGSSDATKPTKPGSLSLVSVTARTATMTWTASTDNAMFRYDILRAVQPGGPYEVAGSVPADTSPLQFTDENLVAGTSYYFVVQAVDTSYNLSDYSNELAVVTETSLVSVTVRVTVPDFTTGKVYINRVVSGNGSVSGVNWQGTELTATGQPNTYQTTLTLREGTPFTFRFSRGSENTVQTNADGNSPATAPDFVATAGVSLVERAVLNWDDPIVIGHWPNTEQAQMTAPIMVTWNQPMPESAQFLVQDITSDPVEISGVFFYQPSTRTTSFIANGSFPANRTYQVNVANQIDLKGIQQVIPFSWSFETDLYQLALPMIQR